jgi:hypothetical protein
MPVPTDALNGRQNEATLDQANIAMRSMPWYQDMLKSFGQSPDSVHLNDQQKQAVVKGAQAHGFVIDEGDMQIDNSGNIDKKGHKLRNTLIVAGIAGATIATMGAAGVFAGAAMPAATGVGGMSATSLGLGTTAGLGTAGATATTLGTAAAGASTLSRVAQAAKLAQMGGSAIGKMTTAAGNNRLDQEQLALGANRDNIAGNKAAEDALMERSKLEGSERRSALIDVARASDTRNPNRSVYNTSAPKVNSPEYMSTLTDLEQRAMGRLKTDAAYGTNNMTPLAGYKPLNLKELQEETDTKPSLMERIGQYAGPAMSLYGAYSGK